MQRRLLQQIISLFFPIAIIVACHDTGNAEKDIKPVIKIGMSVEEILAVPRFSKNCMMKEGYDDGLYNIYFKYKPRSLFESIKKEWRGGYYQFVFDEDTLIKIYWYDENENLIKKLDKIY